MKIQDFKGGLAERTHDAPSICCFYLGNIGQGQLAAPGTGTFCAAPKRCQDTVYGGDEVRAHSSAKAKLVS